MRMPALAALLALVVALLGMAPHGADADGPQASARTAVLEALPQADQEYGQAVTMSVRLTNTSGEPLKAEPVSFWVLSPMFGGRLMNLGEIETDAAGIASIVYRPTWTGPHKAEARFAGTDAYDSTRTPISFNAAGPPAVYHGHPFGIDPIRTWLPLVGIGLTLFVWGALGFVVLTTVAGVRRGALTHRVLLQAPLPKFTSPWAERPAPFRAGIIVIIVVVIAAALAGVLLLPRGEDNGTEGTVPDTGGHGGGAERLANEIPVTLLRSVQTLAMNQAGQFEPESATLAPALAVGEDEIFILDRTKGRIMNVASDGTLSQWMAGGPPPGTEQPMPGGTVGGVSIRNAADMAVHSDRLYVADTNTSTVVVVVSPGSVLAVLEPLVPAAEKAMVLRAIAVTPSGDIWLSDSANHRVLSINAKGELGALIGDGRASSGTGGLDTPGNIGLDAQGNVYVVDEGNHRVVKYSPLGLQVLEIGKDVLVKPRDVAVDELGRIFVTDAARGAVVVFEMDGHVLGSITRERVAEPDSEPWFEFPEAVYVHERTLYVLDRLAGLKVFDLGPRWIGQ